MKYTQWDGDSQIARLETCWILEWRLWFIIRNRGRFQTWWTDDIKKLQGTNWIQTAQNQKKLTKLGVTLSNAGGISVFALCIINSSKVYQIKRAIQHVNA